MRHIGRMLKLITEFLFGWTPEPEPADWRRNPLAHPDLSHMDERALADLQFRPERVLPD